MDLDKVGKYKITAKIGQGAMGEVFKAHDPILNRYVAIKTMSTVIGADDELRKRFLREAQSAARLNHPNIITLFDFGEDQGKIYMAMELLEGNDLKDLIGNQAVTQLEDKLGFMEQICDGLAFAHTQDVVHRDLKPANIHVQPNGQIKIMDFGLARLGTSEMTRTGMVMGTPHYMSPEQVKGKRADSRSDIFSLGAVFYELLTGHKAFDAESLHAVLFQVMEHQPEDVRHWSPEVPNILVQVVDKALAKDPEERYQHAGEMREALRMVRQVLAGEVDEDHALATLIQQSPADSTYVTDPPVEATVLEPPPARSGTARVQGSAALKPASSSRFGKTSVPARTAPRIGSSPPAMRSGARRPSSRPPAAASTPALPAAPSRMPLYIGGVVAVIAIGVVAAYLLRTPPPPPPSPSPSTGTEQLLIGQMVEVARKNLDLKDYKGAAAKAEEVLKIDSRNAEAAQIRDRARKTLDDLDSAANEARAAVQAGDTEKASRAITRVLEIDPNHPVAAELSSQLNSRFKDESEKARREMRSAAIAADRAKANLTETAAALSRGREAEDLYLKSQFMAATQKFLEARDAYERARSAAQQRLAQASAHPPATIPGTFPTPPPVTAPPVTAPPPTLPPITQAPATLPPVTAPPVTAPPSEEPAVRRVIANYARALQTKDLALFVAVKPNLSGAEEAKLKAAFANIKDWQVNISISSVVIDGNQATVRASRNDVVNGKSVNLHQTFMLTKGSGGWTIREIGQ